MRLLGLPLGEWLFFITVPFACLFTWEVLAAYFPNREWKAHLLIKFSLYFLFIAATIFAGFHGKEYTFFVSLALIYVLSLDIFLRTHLFRQSRTYWFSGLLFIMMLIFNGYLTARPVVQYAAQYQLDIRIYTIPIEDFFYGFSLIFLNLVLYTKFEGKSHV